MRTPYTFVKIIPLDYSGREEQVFKKIMFEFEPRNVANIISCFVCCPSGGDFIREILRGLIDLRIPNLILDKVFPRKSLFIAPAIVRAALYCIDSSFRWKELL